MTGSSDPALVGYVKNHSKSKASQDQIQAQFEKIGELFDGRDAQVFADLAGKVVVNFVVAGNRRTSILTGIVPPRMASTLT